VSNVPNRSPSDPAGGMWRHGRGGLTGERLRVLTELMIDLRGLGRGSSLLAPATGEGLLFVPLPRTGRRMPVLGLQDGRGRWSYLWDGGYCADADGTMRAAHQIAAVRW